MSICQLFLCTFLLLNIFQKGRGDSDSSDEDDVYRKPYQATKRILSSFTPPTCTDLFFNNSNIRSKYISSEGLSGRNLPTTDLALDFLDGLRCPVGFQPPARPYISAVDLVRISYDRKSFVTQTQFILRLTNNLINSSTFYYNQSDFLACAHKY